MYDFWYSLGAATMDPKLLRAVAKAGPVFNFIDRKVIEIKNGVEIIRRGPSTGLLDRDSTTKTRLAIAKFLKLKKFPARPPIGIYTAGRFCQLMKIPCFQNGIPNSDFTQIIRLTHRAYVRAVGRSLVIKLAAFPALLGLCLMDAQLSSGIRNWSRLSKPKRNPLNEVLSEFGITVGDKHWKIVSAFVSDSDFDSAVNFLLAGDENPWAEQGNTLEQVFFWLNDGTLKGEHAIP